VTTRPKYVPVDRVVMEAIARDLGVTDPQTMTNAELTAAVYNAAASARRAFLVSDD
jgi:hypothetical protein